MGGNTNMKEGKNAAGQFCAIVPRPMLAIVLLLLQE